MTASRGWQPETPADLAKRYVWWQPPERTLDDLKVLLWHILRLGTADDYVLARGSGARTRSAALSRRHDPVRSTRRSWEFWHGHFRMKPRPFPVRRFE